MNAQRALKMPSRMLTQLVRSWSAGVDLIWNTPAPAEVLAALGTSGAELFQRSAALRAFLESQKPGCTATPAAARIKPVTVKADGTVTLAAAAPASATH
jgi:hypothetical protein